ncbi:MAG: hypothetical protein ABL907_22100 [Hyphomicrobium sp.]
MFKSLGRPAKPRHIDLETVRETLLYIESDCKTCPGLERLSAALAQTISEIDRVNDRSEPQPRADVISVSFVPAGL